ncbi:MAG: O-antigen ligase family protein [Alphaproteobacteria bacterium]
MNTQSLSWYQEIREVAFTQDATHRLWQIAYFSALMIPFMLVGHRTAADVLCGLIGFLFIIRSASKKDWAWVRDPLMITLFIAWGWLCVVVTPLAHDVQASASIAFPWIRFLLFFAAMRHWVLVDAKPIKMLGACLSVLLIAIAVDTIWQYVHGVSLSNHYAADSGRLTGPFNNVKVGIYLARMLLPVLGICLFFSLMESRVRMVLLTYGMLYFFILGTIAVTGERAPFGMSVLGMLTVLGALALMEKNLRAQSLALVAVMCGIVYLMVTTQDWVYGRLLHAAEILMDFRNSSYGQLFWMAYEMGKDNLITGVGMKNFRLICEQFIASGLANHHNLHPHNPYLEWFSEAGLPGLMLFIGFVGLVLRECITSVIGNAGRYRMIAIFALGSVVVLLFPFVPTQSFFANWPAILFWYALSVALASLSLCQPKKHFS